MKNRKSAAWSKRVKGRPPLIKSIPVEASVPQPDENECVGCGTKEEILIALPRDTNPKDLFPKYVNDTSRGCISCVYHAIQVHQVREAMSYKLDDYEHPKHCCLVCNATSGLMPMSSVEGAREAISHSTINAPNIKKYLKVQCRLCISCAYPLQWLYNTVPMSKAEPRLTPAIQSSGRTAKRSASALIVVKKEVLSSDLSDEENTKSSRRKSISNVPAKTSKSNAHDVTIQNGLAQTRARRNVKLEIKVVEVEDSPATKQRTKKATQISTATRTRRVNPIKKMAFESEEEVGSPPPLKKSKAEGRQSRLRTRALPRVTKTTAKQSTKGSIAPKSIKGNAKRVRPRFLRPSLSPPPKLMNRRNTEPQERVCETCQQIFYSGLELALHELRHTGKVLRVSLDRYEIPEPLQKMDSSYLFESPVNLAGPSQSLKMNENEKLQFEFSEPEQLTETQNKPEEADVQEEEKEVPAEEQVPFEVDSRDNSMDNTDSHDVVGNLIDSLKDPTDDDTLAKEVPEPPRATLITNMLSFDFFAPSSPKESRKSVDNSPCEELKTPPPVIGSLSFDFYGPDDDSPSKNHSMFGAAHVDPARALKLNSANPSMPIPSDSDSSFITPPKVRPIEVEQTLDDPLI
ncbi:uncharacterized protein LOC135935214 isoform X2 [Cloeon dipterum]|uniref:uncharacterized protein LOC135935214 isoform X2 n=1 Tax=Cloeon dipterum TaxID=197152 RepID=UPI00322017DC